MRQLDLFGFFETPEENKPGENAAVVKKEEGGSIAETTRPSYSKNTLRSESLAANQVGVTIMNREAEKEKEPVSQPGASTSSSTLSHSLLNSSSAEEDNSAIKLGKPSETSEEAQFVEEQIEPVSADETFAAIISDDPEPSITEGILNEPILPTRVSEPLIAEEKKVVLSKPKKQYAPELQRNGEVIFDDGKITVKIKSKSPFPPPITKEKKAKVEKVIQKRGRKSFKEIDAEVDLIEIPEDEILFQKQYYSISEVAKWFRVNTSLLRFWENEFDVLKPRKNRKGDRLFRPEDVKNLQLIYQLLRQRKYTIDGAKEYLKTNKKKADIQLQLQLTNTLQKFRSFLLDLKVNLEA